MSYYDLLGHVLCQPMGLSGLVIQLITRYCMACRPKCRPTLANPAWPGANCLVRVSTMHLVNILKQRTFQLYRQRQYSLICNCKISTIAAESFQTAIYRSMYGCAQTSAISAFYLLIVLGLIARYTSSYILILVAKPRPHDNVQLDTVFSDYIDPMIFLYRGNNYENNWKSIEYGSCKAIDGH